MMVLMSMKNPFLYIMIQNRFSDLVGLQELDGPLQLADGHHQLFLIQVLIEMP
jgi:hypothetical protein